MGVLDGISALFGLNQYPTAAQLQTAQNQTGVPANQFAGFGPPAQSSGVGNALSAATNSQDPSSLAGIVGSAPRSDVGTGGTGILGGLTSFLTNPLTQAAADAYFTGISQPKHTSFWGRLGAGGLAGMQNLEQGERQAKYGDPYLQQQLLQAQGGTQQQALQNQILARQAAKVPQTMITRLQQFAAQEEQLANAPGPDGKPLSPEEKAYYEWNANWMRSLAEGAANNTLDVQDVTSALSKHDEAKQQNELMQSQMRYYQGRNIAAGGNYMFGLGGPMAAPGAGGPGTAAPGDTAPAPVAAAPGAVPPNVVGWPAGQPFPSDLATELSILPKGFLPNLTPGPSQNVRKVGDAWQFNMSGEWMVLDPTTGNLIFVG